MWQKADHGDVAEIPGKFRLRLHAHACCSLSDRMSIAMHDIYPPLATANGKCSLSDNLYPVR